MCTWNPKVQLQIWVEREQSQTCLAMCSLCFPVAVMSCGGRRQGVGMTGSGGGQDPVASHPQRLQKQLFKILETREASQECLESALDIAKHELMALSLQ